MCLKKKSSKVGCVCVYKDIRFVIQHTSLCVWVCMYDVITRMIKKLNQQEVDWQQVQESLNRRNRDIKRLSKENSGALHQQRAGEKTKGAEMEETGYG